MTGVRWFIRLAANAIACVGLGALLYVGFVVAQAMNATAAPLPPVVRHRALVAGEALGQLRIERLGLRAAITEGELAPTLRRGVGHLSDTPWIGQGGNVALAGHRDTTFRALQKIQSGDVIEIATAEGSVHYRVEKAEVVAPHDLTVLKPSDHSRLTLITCYPFTFFGSAPARFVVHATEIGPPSGRRPGL